MSQSGVAVATPGPAKAPEWWFDTWGVPALWAAGARGGGVTIAEIDTGVAAAVPQIANKLVPGKDFGVGGGNGYIDHATEDFGHGTAMASIMVASDGPTGVVGLAPDARIMPISLPIAGTDDASSAGSDHLAEAIRWAADHGGKIVSMSLGGARYPNEDSVPCPADEQDAITYAVSKGLIVVAASGNAAETGSPVEDPGVCLGVVSVGAVDRNNAVAVFSSRHPYLTMSAPGVNIASLSPTPGTGFYSRGTSQSTALVSASLALIWSKFPTLSARQILAKALSSLDHASATRDPGYGFGIINPARAISAGNQNAANPVYDALDPYLTKLAAGVDPAAGGNQSGTKVPPAALSAIVPGTFRVGKPPSTWSSPILTALGVAVAGVIALIALSTGAFRARRRRASPAETTPEIYAHGAGLTYATAGDGLSSASTFPLPNSSGTESAADSPYDRANDRANENLSDSSPDGNAPTTAGWQEVTSFDRLGGDGSR